MDSFTDELLGQIAVCVNARARHIIMRPQVGGVRVTVPPYTPMRVVKETLERWRERLCVQQRELKESSAEQTGGRIDLDFRIDAPLLKLELRQGERPDFYCNARPGETVIVCPPDTRFEEAERQEWLRLVVEKALRQQAVWQLPQRLRELSVRHGLPFGECKINVSKGRWGSCSVRKDINLSCYLMLLPLHLMEYVMLHELCHTVEMNHGTRFWKMLDGLTEGRSGLLRNELRHFRTGF